MYWKASVFGMGWGIGIEEKKESLKFNQLLNIEKKERKGRRREGGIEGGRRRNYTALKSEVIFLLGIWWYQLSIDLLKQVGDRQDRREESEISSIITESQRLYFKFINPKKATYACYLKRYLLTCQRKTVEEWLNPAPAERKAEQCVEQWDRELHGRYDEPSRMIRPLNCMLPLL